MEKQNGLKIVNYSWTSIGIWTPIGKILMFSRWYKYFQFVSWNKISFWNVIAVASLAKWKTLQTHSMYYCRKQRPTFSVWRENFFSALVSKTVIHKANIMNQWWKILETPLGLYLLEVPQDTKWLTQVNYGKRKNYLMVQRVEWNLRVTLSFTQTAPKGSLPVMLIFWSPDVINKTDESVNPLQ